MKTLFCSYENCIVIKFNKMHWFNIINFIIVVFDKFAHSPLISFICFYQHVWNSCGGDPTTSHGNMINIFLMHECFELIHYYVIITQR